MCSCLVMSRYASLCHMFLPRYVNCVIYRYCRVLFGSSGGSDPSRVRAAMSFTVQWTTGQTTLRQHTFQAGGKVLACTPATFDDDSCLAVLQAEQVTIYRQDGTAFTVALSKRPRSMWPLRRGVLIEPYPHASPASPPLRPQRLGGPKLFRPWLPDTQHLISLSWLSLVLLALLPRQLCR